eukprot:1699045-Alexandrium_andersonii.AAC.1
MSASLVGSEMCIRDSCCGVERHYGSRRRWLGEPFREDQGHLVGRDDAVSYTHLTLPTICSV